jgi:hypothetical protein
MMNFYTDDSPGIKIQPVRRQGTTGDPRERCGVRRRHDGAGAASAGRRRAAVPSPNSNILNSAAAPPVQVWVIVMSLGFILFVTVLHIIGKVGTAVGTPGSRVPATAHFLTRVEPPAAAASVVQAPPSVRRARGSRRRLVPNPTRPGSRHASHFPPLIAPRSCVDEPQPAENPSSDGGGCSLKPPLLQHQQRLPEGRSCGRPAASDSSSRPRARATPLPAAGDALV